MSLIPIGTRVNNLTIIEDAGFLNRRKYKCRCICGNETIVRATHLLSGHTKSCGCLLKRAITKHGASYTREYSSWLAMIRRCTDENSPNYSYYGGKGILPCKEWLDFNNFIADMGIAPTGTTLERKNNGLGYYKENCKWASPKEQANNRSSNLQLEYKGELLTCAQLAEKTGINYFTLWNRVTKGMSAEEAVNCPVIGAREVEYNGEILDYKEAAKHAGLKPNTLYTRLFVYGWSIEKALTTPTR